MNVEHRRDLRALVASQIYKNLTTYLAGRSGRPYPLAFYGREVPQKVRLWLKRGPEEEKKTDDEINEWIQRAKDYPANREKEIERTAAVQIRTEMLTQALKSDVKFPLAIELPLNMAGGKVVLETQTYKDAKAAQEEIDRLLTVESDRFDHRTSHSVTRARFLLPRDIEQAELLRWLEIVLTELRKFPDALHHPQKRQARIDELAELLDRKALRPRESTAFKLTRQLLLEEVNNYAFGKGEALPKDGLRLNDLNDLGVEKGKLSLKSKALRFGIIWASMMALQFGSNHVSGPMKEAVSYFFDESSYLDQIAAKSESDFNNAAHEYLVTRYGLHSVNGSVIWTQDAKAAADRIAAARQQFLKKLADAKLEIDQVALAMKPVTANVSADLFSDVMKSRDDNTAKQKIAAAGITEAATVKNLMSARSEFQGAIAQNGADAATELLKAYTDYEIEKQ